MKLEHIEAGAIKLKANLVHQEKHLAKFWFALAKSIIQYAFIGWIYLGLYGILGFEKTIVIMFVGVMIYNLKVQYADAGQQVEHEKRLAALEKGVK